MEEGYSVDLEARHGFSHHADEPAAILTVGKVTSEIPRPSFPLPKVADQTRVTKVMNGIRGSPPVMLVAKTYARGRRREIVGRRRNALEDDPLAR